ncbi:MAG: hypothetical protein Fur007_18590 [Rhodoferax sp.]
MGTNIRNTRLIRKEITTQAGGMLMSKIVAAAAAGITQKLSPVCLAVVAVRGVLSGRRARCAFSA